MTKSVGLWILQRISAVALVLLLGLHLWVNNFATEWAAFLKAFIDLCLLAIALFHGLNGVRTIVLDFGIGSKARQFLSVSLVTLGITAFLFGVFGFWPLIFTK
jgi:succinate dehydrogenase / fumarate reductase membrane anchor subunit